MSSTRSPDETTEVRKQVERDAPEETRAAKDRWARERIVHGAMYGVKSYIPGADRADLVSMLSALIQMHRDGTLSEGQVAYATRLDRVTIRHLCDRMTEREEQAGASQ